MIAVLTGIFGGNNLVLVEDIVQDTLMEAISNWTYNGVPENPIGWLYKVAKNKTLNALKRKKNQEKYISESLYLTNNDSIQALEWMNVFSPESILDDQLRMMFMCCHPAISQDSQIALILKTLCGFSIGEIAKSFLTNNESINKRLVRARKTIRQNSIPFEVPPKEQLEKRLEAVLEAIYLLFNEGYSASVGEQLIREDLCKESIRLTDMLIEHQFIRDQSNTYALIALMQLNTSRFKAREDLNGNILTLKEQDRTLWDFYIMEQGFSNLEKATQNAEVSKYHILASISAYHCSAKNFESTDWKSILSLYNRLIEIDNSPMLILNKAIALFNLNKMKEAVHELDRIEDEKTIKSSYLFYATKAELHFQMKNLDLAKIALIKAIELAPLTSEKRTLTLRFKKYFGIKHDNDVPISKS